MSEITINSDYALGLITRHFQRLEFYLSVFSWGLMGKDQRIGQAVTTHLSFSKLLTLVDALFRQRTQKSSYLEGLNAVISQAAAGEQRRNRAIHSAYIQTSDDPNARQIRYKVAARLKKGLVYQWEDTSLDDLLDIATELRQTTDLLVAFIARVRVPLAIDFSGVDTRPRNRKQNQRADDEDIPF
jgi:hypothetical protein